MNFRNYYDNDKEFKSIDTYVDEELTLCFDIFNITGVEGLINGWNSEVVLFTLAIPE